MRKLSILPLNGDVSTSQYIYCFTPTEAIIKLMLNYQIKQAIEIVFMLVKSSEVDPEVYQRSYVYKEQYKSQEDLMSKTINSCLDSYRKHGMGCIRNIYFYGSPVSSGRFSNGDHHRAEIPLP